MTEATESDSSAELLDLKTDEEYAIENAISFEEEIKSPKKKRAILRLALLVFIVGGSYLIAWKMGITDLLTPEYVRELLLGSGVKGIALFVLIFIAGNLVQIPSNIFIGAAIYVYGFWWGVPLCYSTNILSIVVSFVLVRTIGGQPLELVKRRWLLKALNQVDTHPYRSVMFLRSFLGGSPPLTYTMAMSSIRFRDHLFATMLGLIPPMLVMCTAFAWYFDKF